MLGKSETFSSFSVDNVQRAKAFYGETLDLKTKEGMMGTLELHLNGTTVFIYPKENHQPATFTVLNFIVDDIDEAVKNLKSKGITFEHYGGEIQTDENGISRGNGGPNIAWFKDPAGNVLSVLEE